MTITTNHPTTIGSGTNRYDIAVVGAGLAGLAAADLAARRGARVVLVDAHRPGGRARSTDREGFRFNEGAHALYLGGKGMAVLGSLGIRPTGGEPGTAEAGGAWWWYRGELHALPTSGTGLARSRALSAGSKVKLARLLAGLGRLDPRPLADRTLDEWIDERRLADDAAALVRLLVRTSSYAAAHDQISADAALAQLELAVRGVRYVDGGWQSIVDALVGAARRAGVDVLTGTPVRAITRDGARHLLELGSDVDGARPEVPWPDSAPPAGAPEGTSNATAVPREVVAGAVILATGGPAVAARLLGADPWEPAGPPVHASALDLGVTAPPPRALVLDADAPHYLSVHTPPARLAPEGCGVVCLLQYHQPGAPVSAPSAGRAALEAYAARSGVDMSTVTTKRYLHRMVVTHLLPTPAGGGLAGRPGVAVADAPGVFLAGDWVGPDGMLADASLASASAAAEAAVAQSRKVPA